MIFRIFIAFMALLCVYTVYDTAKVAMAKSSALKANDAYVLEAKNADLTVVEYIDYACIDCQQMHPVLMRSINRDGKIKLIVRPLPSFQSESGTQAGLLVYAAGRQGKFIEAHKALIADFRTIDGNYISNFALKVGLDTEKLESDLADPSLIDHLNDNVKSLKAFRGETIPALLIGDRILMQINNIPDSDELVSLFAQARTL